MDKARTRVGRDEIAREEGARLAEESPKMVHRVARDRSGEIGAGMFSVWTKENSYPAFMSDASLQRAP